jgi:hypothetical protein
MMFWRLLQLAMLLLVALLYFVVMWHVSHALFVFSWVIFLAVLKYYRPRR